MIEKTRFYSQDEYTRILDAFNARTRKLTQRECERILMDHDASHEQAKNGAYVYLHHGDHTEMIRKGTQDEYDQLLDNFGAMNKQPKECIKYLENLGYSYGQVKSAVYKYRVNRGLIRSRK